MTVARCTPTNAQQLSHETLPWRFDFSALLGSGESVMSATANLIDTNTGLAYAAGISGSPLVGSPYVTVTVTALVPKHHYRIEVIGTVSASKIWELPLVLDVPY